MTLKVTTPSDTDIRITRWFNAARPRVYRALTDASLIARWLQPDGFSLIECTSDVRIGGMMRLAWRGEAGGGMAVTIVLQDLVADRLIVGRERFDDAWYPGEAVVTQELADDKGGSTLTVTISYESKTARDGVLKTPMTDGMGEVYDRLAELLGGMGQ
jgi:uncharacterized protein YndB with AHSA1/START domain